MILLETRNLHKIYEMDGEKVHAIDNVNLKINKGDFLSIIGPSGCGKSTLMHLLGCLDKPTSGKIVFDGKDLSKLSENELAKIRNQKIGFVFQTYNLLPKTPAISNVELPLIYTNISPKKRKELAIKALKMVGLLDRANHYPSQLSGGQQQKIAIARALINNPSVILADEPTGNLDSKSGQEIIHLLKNLNQKGNTIVLVTHDHSIAHQAKKIIHLLDGKIVQEERL